MSKAEPKPKTEHPLDAARKVLHAPKAAAAEIEAARDNAGNVRDAAAAAIEDKRIERANIMLSDENAAAIEAKAEAVDDEVAALMRRQDLAAATEDALEKRLAAVRAADGEKVKLASAGDPPALPGWQ